MHDDTISLRQPDAAELRTWFGVLDAAFADEVSDAEYELERIQFEPDRVIGAVEGDAWVGAGAGYSLRLTVPGGVDVGAVGITAIGVTPSHRRRGILRQVMGWLVDQAGERGEPLAILWASETAIYQRFGFGIGTLQGTFDIERSRTRFAHPVEPLGRMRLVDRDEALELIPPVYEAIAATDPGGGQPARRQVAATSCSTTPSGCAAATGASSSWCWRSTARSVAMPSTGSRPNGTSAGPNNTVTTIEVLGLDAAAERTIWEWLFGIDLVGHIKGWRTRVPHAAAAPAGRASPARAGRPRRHAPADPRPARGARGARLRHGRLGHVRGERRVPAVECRSVAADGDRWSRVGRPFRGLGPAHRRTSPT